MILTLTWLIVMRVMKPLFKERDAIALLLEEMPLDIKSGLWYVLDAPHK
jgi:hypothetical protein